MVKIHEFDPVIYPVKIWVIDMFDEIFINNEYEEINGNKLHYQCNEMTVCSVYNRCVIHKSTEKYGFLITIKDKNELNINYIAHEATHAARFIWDYLGEGSTGIEADAYLVGWIASCIEKVKNDDEHGINTVNLTKLLSE